MDLVDEEHVAAFELGQDSDQVTGANDRRSGGGVQLGIELPREDACKAGLAQARGAGQQDVVGGLAAFAGGLDRDPEVADRALLAHEFLEAART